MDSLSIVDFPPELVTHIIRLSVPAPSLVRSVHLARHASLLSYSLVSQTWRILARNELHAHLIADGTSQADALADALSRRPPGTGARTQLVRLLQVGSKTIGRVLSAFPNREIHEVWACGRSEYDWAVFEDFGAPRTCSEVWDDLITDHTPMQTLTNL